MSDPVTSWTAPHQAPLFIECSRQEYWSRLPFLSPGDLPDPGIEPISPVSPAVADGFFTTVTFGLKLLPTLRGLLLVVLCKPHGNYKARTCERHTAHKN